MRRALLVACSQFDRDPEVFPNLRYSLRDARRLAELLGDPEYGYFDEIKLLENPRTAEVKTTLEKMARQGREGDLFLFFYSGHGKIDINAMLTLIMPESDSELLSTTSLPADELKRFFNMSPASQKVIILDSCYSGAIGAEEFKAAPEDIMKDLARQTSGTFVIAATTRFQLAHEVEAMEAGLLTNFLIQGVRSGAAAPPGSDCVTVAQIADYVADQVPQFRHQQPQAWQTGSTGKVIFSKLPKRFDAEWERLMLLETSRLHFNGDIDQTLTDEIREAVRDRSNPARRPVLMLLDALLEKKITRNRFVLRWHEMNSRQEPPAAVAGPSPRPPEPPPPRPAHAPAPSSPRPANAPVARAGTAQRVRPKPANPALAARLAKRLRRLRERWRWPRKRTTLLVLIPALILLLPIVAVGVTVIGLPSFEELKSRDRLGQSIRARDSLGGVLLLSGPTFGEWIPYSGIPKTAIDAIRAAEADGPLSPISPFASQLERSIFQSRGPLRRFLLSAALEWKFESHELLELYLNRTYFGAAAYGIDSASRSYFGHGARTLAPGEAAILAGIPKAPSRYNPFADPPAAKRRGLEVLEEMRLRRLIAGTDARAAVDSVQFAPRPNRKNTPFTDWALSSLNTLIDETVEPIEVWTTLDSTMQRTALRVLDRAPAGTSAALLVLDREGSVRALAATGAVKALDLKRPAGPMFDVFRYLARLEAESAPAGGAAHELIGTLDQIFTGGADRNTAEKRAVRDMAQRMGLGSSTALDGSEEVRLLDLARAFAILQNKGAGVVPYSVRRVTTAAGQILYQHQPSEYQILAPYVVEGAVGTLIRPQKEIGALGLGRTVAARAALAPAKRDAWFVGFAGGLTVAVWTGRDDRADPALIRTATSIFKATMAAIVVNRSADWFAPLSPPPPPPRAGGREPPEPLRGTDRPLSVEEIGRALAKSPR